MPTRERGRVTLGSPRVEQAGTPHAEEGGPRSPESFEVSERRRDTAATDRPLTPATRRRSGPHGLRGAFRAVAPPSIVGEFAAGSADYRTRTPNHADSTSAASAERCSYVLSRVDLGEGAGRPVMGHSSARAGSYQAGRCREQGWERRVGRSFAGQPWWRAGISGARPAARSWRYARGRWRYTSRAT